MKNYSFLFFLIFTCTAFSQIEVGNKYYSSPRPIKAEVLEKFKKSTTLFVLPDHINIESYDSILKDVWTVNPYKVITFDDFDITESYDENYSFFTIDFQKKNRKNKTGNSITALHSYFDLSLYDGPEITKRINKFDDRVKDKKLPIILKGNRTSLLKFYLYPTDEFVQATATGNRNTILEGLYATDIFYNYSKGMLKNYIQKIHSLILKGNDYSLELKDYDAAKLRELKTTTLYVPEYLTLKTNIIKAKVVQMKDKEIKNLFQAYNYSYETISKEALSDAIINGEELFYLRYVRVDDQKFLQVVNAATGETIFRDYIKEFTFNLKQKNFEYFSDVIDQVNN